MNHFADFQFSIKSCLVLLSIPLAIISVLSIVFRQQPAEKNIGDRGSFLQHNFLKRLQQYLSNKWLSLALISLVLVMALNPIAKEVSDLRNQVTTATGYFDDLRWSYTASEMVRDRLNPYRPDAFISTFIKDFAAISPEGIKLDAAPFVYPPNVIPLILPLSYLSFPTAEKVFLIVNLIAVSFLLYGGIVLVKSHSKAIQATCLISCALLFGVTYSLTLGNLAAIVATLVVWTVILVQKNKNIWAGILLGISTIKPTTSIFFLPYFLWKKRFSLVACSIVVSLILSGIGLLLTNDSIFKFLTLFKSGKDIWSNNYWNSIHTSYTRIDLEVVLARVFPHSSLAVKLSFGLCLAAIISSILFYLYKRQKKSNSTDIALAEVSLIACLSTLAVYSQQQSTTILVLAIAFLLNYLVTKINSQSLTRLEFCFWCLGCTCLIIHTHLFYNYFLYYFATETPKMPYLLQITLASIPNYAILGLMISLLFLAISSLRGTKAKLKANSTTKN